MTMSGNAVQFLVWEPVANSCVEKATIAEAFVWIATVTIHEFNAARPHLFIVTVQHQWIFLLLAVVC